MSPTSYQTAPPRECILGKTPGSVKAFLVGFGGQQAAGGGDVQAATFTDGGQDAGRLQDALERLNALLRRSSKRDGGGFVQGQEIDLAPKAAQQPDQLPSVLRSVVHPIDQH